MKAIVVNQEPKMKDSRKSHAEEGDMFRKNTSESTESLFHLRQALLVCRRSAVRREKVCLTRTISGSEVLQGKELWLFHDHFEIK